MTRGALAALCLLSHAAVADVTLPAPPNNAADANAILPLCRMLARHHHTPVQLARLLFGTPFSTSQPLEDIGRTHSLKLRVDAAVSWSPNDFVRKAGLTGEILTFVKPAAGTQAQPVFLESLEDGKGCMVYPALEDGRVAYVHLTLLIFQEQPRRGPRAAR